MTDMPTLSYRGKPPTSAMLVELFTNAETRFGGTDGRTDRITKCRDLRRGTETVKISDTFLKEHPEIDQKSAISIMAERESYERDLITRAASVDINISREPLDVTDSAVDYAEEYEAYEREVAFDEEHGVPTDAFFEKLTEDGEVGVLALPWHLDAEGIPDFYDRLTERAVKRMKTEDRKAYSKDENDRRGRYVRRDGDGKRVTNPTYDRDAKGQTRKQAKDFKRDEKKSREAHEAAVRRYLLQHSATTFRVVEALNCYPLLGRGHGKARWSVEGLIERTAFDRETLVEKKLGWNMLGDRLILPKGVSQRHGTVGKDSFYLYTAYLMLKADDDDECPYHPCILYTVGGAGTWWDGFSGDDKDKGDHVAVIDLYEEFGIKERRWDYAFGLHTSDDDPNYYGRPAIWPHRRRILNIEGLETAAQVTVQLSAYTGHYYKPDTRIMELDPEAVVDSQTHLLRRPKQPGPGQIEPWAGDVLPFTQAKIGDDHWRLQANHQAALAQSMALTEPRGDSGHAMLVSSQQGLVSLAHIRSAALRLFKFCLEADAGNRLAAWECHQVQWPILTQKERPVGHEVRSRIAVSEFDAENWLGEDRNVKLNVEYGEEFNLAKADFEMNAYANGVGTLKRVAAALGEDSEMNLRFQIAKDNLWKMPESQMILNEMVMSLRGMKRQQQIRAMQAEQRMTAETGMPGAEGGLPVNMLKRRMEAAGAQQGGGGNQGAPYAASVRGGITGAQMAGDAMALNAGGQGQVA